MKKLTVSLCTLLLVIDFASVASANEYWLDGVSMSSGWTDAEKIQPISASNGDSNLCWAAAASNLIAYTGWGTSTLSSAQDIFGFYKQNWTNVDGSTFYGLKWWFDGTNMLQGVAGRSQLESTSTWTGISSTTDFNNNVSFHPFDLVTVINGIAAHDGMQLSVAWMNSSGVLTGGGHAITLWGINTTLDELFITDSDDGFNGIETVHYYTDAYDPAIYEVNFWYYNAIAVISDISTLSSSAGPAASVPEPTTMLLFGTGIAGLAGIARRKRS